MTRADLQAVTHKIVSEFQPSKVILFGSQAWGIPSQDSDIDLFIVKDTDNTRALAHAIDGALFPRAFPIDIMVYTPKQVEHRKRMGDLFIKKIFSEGTILHDS